MREIKRVRNFKEHGLGMFIHYGLYNLHEKGEWYQAMYKLNTSEYLNSFGVLKDLVLKLNVKQIVQTAKENGVKYIVLSTKHHDGFALYDSAGLNPLDITKVNENSTKIVDEFVKECLEQKIEPFFYHATWDWSHPDYENNFDKYLDYLHANIELLCQKYPQVKGFWFDGNWNKKDADWKEDRLYSTIRQYIPEAIIINNSGLANAGKEQHCEVDSITFEQGHMGIVDYSKFSRDLAAESCQSFNDHWGYGAEDYNYKSVKDLIRNFLKARRIKANYLLNLSINKNGEMIPLEIETLRLLNRWIMTYGYSLLGDYEVIFITEDDFLIKKNNKYYLFLYHVISGGHVKKIQYGGQFQEERNYKTKIRMVKAKYLDNDKSVALEQTATGFKIKLEAFDYGTNTIVRVIEMEEEKYDKN